MPATYLSILRALQFAAVLACFCVASLTSAPSRAQKPDPTAAGVIGSWNEAIGTLDTEETLFRELLASYRLNPPGRVLLTPDVRAAQRARRLKLIDEVIQLHTARIQKLRDLARYEKALQ